MERLHEVTQKSPF
jgi:hypothetical protein